MCLCVTDPMMLLTTFLQNVGFGSLITKPGTQGAEASKSAVCNAEVSHCYTVIHIVSLLMLYCVYCFSIFYFVCFNTGLPRLKMHGT